MMEKDPARRIQSAAEVAERLEPWASAVDRTGGFADRTPILDTATAPTGAVPAS